MAESPRDLARRLVDAAPAPLPQPLPAEPLALAWALKAACYDAWSTAPAQALHCARLLRQLHDLAGGAEVAALADRAEIGALADWVQGIAHLCEGRSADAVASLDAAHAGFHALQQPGPAAQTRVPQVMALSLLGRHDDAMHCGQDALQQFLALGDELAAGKIEVNLGTLASRQDRHAEAARLFRSAAVRGARASDRSLSIHADIALANALTWLFDFDEATRINQRARMRAQTHGLAVAAALAEGAIGRIALHRGHYHAALRALAAASRGFAQAGASPQQCIEAEAALADAYSAVNLLPEAVALYAQVMARAAAIDAPVELARATLESARAQGRLGHAGQALQGLAAARALFQAQGNAASVALTDLALAGAQLAAGQGAAALDSARRAAAALADSGILGWQLEAEATAAAAAAALGQADAARNGFRQVLAQAEAQGLRAVALACHRGLGALAAAQGETGLARRHLQQALALIDDARVALQGDAFRTAIGADAEQLHDQLVTLALAVGDAPAQLLALLEQGRARALALGMHDSAATPADPALDNLRQRLQWAREQQRLALADGEHGALQAQASRISALEEALLEAHRRAQLAAAAQPGGDALPAGFSAAALQAALPADTALVAFHRLGQRLLACVVRADGVHQVLSDCSGLDERLDGLRFQIDGQRHASQGLQAHAAQLLARVQAHLQALHALVWAGVAPLVQGVARLALVPHRSLHYLPFAALHDGQCWLAERHEISLAPSATLWLAGRARPLPPLRRALALGHGGPGLPQVPAELRAVAAAFGDGGRVVEGAAATRQALRAGLPGMDVLHLACHGQFRADSPSFSSLTLADGELTLLDAQQLPVAGKLVALSACETGLSRVAPGDELLGLVRGFLLAGAPTVLASLWMVDDQSTARLMQAFYQRLAAGERPAAALRAAQMALAASGAHPFHWAAFALHGQA
ncbi:MAG: CHAT domain-containing protein [Pseudomonadota bacterium]